MPGSILFGSILLGSIFSCYILSSPFFSGLILSWSGFIPTIVVLSTEGLVFLLINIIVVIEIVIIIATTAIIIPTIAPPLKPSELFL